MRCPYIFQNEDKLVKSGKRTVGEVCGVPTGKKEWGGHCAGHARKLKLVPQEQFELEKQRRAETRLRKKEMKLDPPDTDGKVKLDENVLSAMGLNNQYDLAEDYALFKRLNQQPLRAYYDEKMVYARWLECPAHLRKPKTMEEVAEILNVTYGTLMTWKTNPEIIDYINSSTENRMLGMFPFAMYQLGKNIGRGDVRSIEAYAKWYEQKQEQRKKSTMPLDIDPDMQKEADDYARSQGELNRGVALKAEKQMVKSAVYGTKEQ